MSIVGLFYAALIIGGILMAQGVEKVNKFLENMELINIMVGSSFPHNYVRRYF